MQDFAATVPGKIIAMTSHDGCLYVATETGVFRSVAHGKFYEVGFMEEVSPGARVSTPRA